MELFGFDEVLLLKPLGEEAPETMEILEKGLGAVGAAEPLGPILEVQLAAFEASG